MASRSVQRRATKVASESAAALLRVDEAAKLLACGERSVWRLLSLRLLPTVKIGASTRIPRAALEDFIARGGEVLDG